jgi:hypothetical protein
LIGVDADFREVLQIASPVERDKSNPSVLGNLEVRIPTNTSGHCERSVLLAIATTGADFGFKPPTRTPTPRRPGDNSRVEIHSITL